MEELSNLIRRSQAGDAEAFGELVSRFQAMAYGYAAAILNDFTLAEDAAQEAFIETYRCLPDLRTPLAFPAWFKRIVFKHCDRLTRRKQVSQTSLDDARVIPVDTPTPDELVETHEIAAQVRAAIRSLPLNQRVVTTLFYIDGYSQDEIAVFLEVPARTVKSRLYTSRQRLKERMMDMVEAEMGAHKLPEGFTQETVDKAVVRAKAMIGTRQYDQAEDLLREVLAQLPDHPAALKELNRALMRGRVYGQGRWDLLPELVRHGQRILESGDDEAVCRDLANTLLAIPAMAEAIVFIEDWIARAGRNLERLGMLAWARGCLEDYAQAEATWQEAIEVAHSHNSDEVLAQVPFIAYTLVDCFAGPGAGFEGYGQGFSDSVALEHARRVAKQAWELCGELGPVPFEHSLPGDGVWLMIFYQARLNLQAIAPRLLARHAQDDPAQQGMRLYLRAWVDEPEPVTADWLNWVRQRIAEREWSLLQQFQSVSFAMRGHGLWDEANHLAQATWELLDASQADDAEQARAAWNWDRFNPVGAIQKKDWKTAEALSQRELQECGLRQGGPWAIVIAAAQGAPTPAALVESAEQHGLDSVDEYGLFGWYLLARQAAFAGEAEQAFTALEKSLGYWSNSPYFYVDIWEQDRCWDGLRDRVEFKRLFAEKHRQIGPVHGMLHYFPGW